MLACETPACNTIDSRRNSAPFDRAIQELRARALPHARALGNAFQLTNFIRDIHEDTAIARQYIPTDMCRLHGILGSVSDASTGAEGIKIVTYPLETRTAGEDMYGHPGLVPLLEEAMAMAEEHYASADEGIAMLPEDGQAVIAVARHAYAAIHHKIRDGGYRIYSTRYRVSFAEKLKIARRVVSATHIARMAAVQLIASLLNLVISACRTVDGESRRYMTPLLGLLSVYAATFSVSQSGVALTYLGFHKAYTLPMLAILCALIALRVPAYARGDTRQSSSQGPRHRLMMALSLNRKAFLLRATAFWTAVLCVVATMYTLPWDDNLVASGIWG